MWYKLFLKGDHNDENVLVAFDDARPVSSYVIHTTYQIFQLTQKYGHHNIHFTCDKCPVIGDEPAEEELKEPPFFWHRSPHFSSRHGAEIHTILLHNTYGDFKNSVKHLSNPARKRDRTSCHIVIPRAPKDSLLFADKCGAKEGEVAALVDERKSAWHGGSRSINKCSIGIEITVEPHQRGMTPWQEQNVIWHCKWLMKKYDLNAKSIRIHREFSNTSCPSLIWHRNEDFYKWREKHFGV